MPTADQLPPDREPKESKLPYRETSEEGYAAAAAGFHREATARATLVLSGLCPRCSHMMEYLISKTTVKSRRWWQLTGRGVTADPPAAPEPEDMCCTCEQAHPGRPADYLGCGAYWTLALG